MAPHSSILAWRIPMDRGAWQAAVRGVAKRQTEQLHFLSLSAEEIGYPLQDSWAFLVTQIVKNLPGMRETWIQYQGWEDPLEEGMAAHSKNLAWRIPMDRGAWQAAVHRVTKSRARLKDRTEQLSTDQHSKETLESLRVMEM